MNPDFHDILSMLCEENADFMVVGAYALAAHGVPRGTGDIDIWVRPTPENAPRVWTALGRFGAPQHDLDPRDLTRPDVVFQIGVVPNRIDLLTSIDAVDFDTAWPARRIIEIEGLQVPVISREHLLVNKKAAGRPKDLADAAWLESLP